MKIAISGAGIAGPTLAFWLHRSGHEVTLIEKAPRLRGGGYMIDFWGVGYAVAERMGILGAVLEAGYPVREIRLLDRRGRKVGGFSADVFRRMTDGHFTSLPRGDLARIAYAAVENRVESIFDDSIRGLDEHASGVRVALAHGVERDFDLVIGTDGLHSSVRTQVFGRQARFEKPLGYRVAAFTVAGYRPRHELVYVSYSVPGRQVARFAMRHDRTMFLFVFRADLVRDAQADNATDCKAQLRDVFADAGWECPRILDEMEAVDELYFDRVSQIRMQAWSKGRVMLLGDAAACVSLLAGEGSGLAMTEAYVLAGELQRARGDYREAYCRCEDRLRPFIAQKQAAAVNFAAAFAPATATGVWIRNFISKLLDFRPLADRFVGRDLRDDFDLPDYDM